MHEMIPHKEVLDQMGRSVSVPVKPQRLISLVPSQTELIFDLGRGSCLVGITRYCIHPKKACANLPVVGGTKNIDKKIIAALQPDLIIANKEENQREDIEQLAQDYPVWVSDVRTLHAASAMIQMLGAILDANAEAKTLIEKIRRAFAALPRVQKPQRAAYLIWRKPYMTVARDTFIHGMLESCGFENVYADSPGRYPVTDAATLAALSPHILLLSSEPFPFADNHVQEFRQFLPQAKITLVDGEMFSWYGSRLCAAPAYFQHLREHLELNE